MTTDELIREIQQVYATLQALETGASTEPASQEASAEAIRHPQEPTLDVEDLCGEKERDSCRNGFDEQLGEGGSGTPR